MLLYIRTAATRTHLFAKVMSVQAGFRIYLTVALLLIISTIAIFAHRNNENGVVHTIWIDPNRYRLRWSVNHKEAQVTFEVAVRTNGWIGLGILRGHKKTQKGADIWIGWIDKRGKSHLLVIFCFDSLLIGALGLECKNFVRQLLIR